MNISYGEAFSHGYTAAEQDLKAKHEKELQEQREELMELILNNLDTKTIKGWVNTEASTVVVCLDDVESLINEVVK